MNVVQTNEKSIKWKIGTEKRMIGAILLVAVLIAVFALMAKAASPLEAQAKPSVNLEQCSNDDPTCDTAHPNEWITGNLGSSDSDYQEGDAVPYRSILNNLVVGHTYKVTLEWDSTVAGKHAIDYLTSFDFSEAGIDPCAGEPCGGGQSTLAIPMDPLVSAALVTQASGENFTVFGGTFPASGTVVTNADGNLCGTTSCTIASNPTSYSTTGAYASESSTSISVFITATHQTAVLSWGGHIASRMDWGVNKSAAVINGSPYHMRVIQFLCTSDSNCSTGNMDRSLSSAAVTLPSSITIVKEASIEGDNEFGFTASPSPLENFTLIDDGTMKNTKAFTGITSFGTHTVTEDSATGWDFDRVSCVINQQTTGSTSAVGASVTIVLGEGEDVVCTFYNEPTPAPALTLEKTADLTSFSAADQTITYTYLLTNTGNTILGPTQFVVTDDKIAGGTPFDCGAADTTLAVLATVSCTSTYTTSTDDVTAGSVVNIATASAGDLTSNSDTATVPYVPVATTTTTIAATTTTVAPTTTLSPTTTLAPELQVLVPGITPGAEDVFDVLLNDELPNAGWGIGMGPLLLGVIVLVAVGLSSVSLGRRNRHTKTGGQ